MVGLADSNPSKDAPTLAEAAAVLAAVGVYAQEWYGSEPMARDLPQWLDKLNESAERVRAVWEA